MELTDHKVFARETDPVTHEEVPTNYFLEDHPAHGVFTFDRIPTGERDMADQPMTRTRVEFRQVGQPNQPVDHRFVVHSTGFEWGYGGSGPAELALNILGLFVPPPEAWRHHHEFKRDFIAGLPDTGGSIPVSAIRDWLEARLRTPAWADA